ncbi:MAG TPA: hypothetical protein VNE39_18150 [Planctomycetota bacterium]|nr:hypothetical protein [Planctomycetota bacterium]
MTQKRPLVGAIRWDAWHGDQGVPGQAVERALGPKRWHARIPFFGKAVSDTQVEIRGYSQEIVDQEIAYARQAGLDYWAFVTYEPDTSMSLALKTYLASSHKGDIRFCLLTECGKWGTPETHRAKVERFLKLMAGPTYQRVLGDRPLLYVGFVRDEWLNAWGGAAGARKLFDEFRAAARKAGLGNPYIVLMEFSPQRGKKLADALGLDALSAYATQAAGNGTPYASLAKHAERFWEQCKATGKPVVPIAMAGWDRRPRVEHPVPWEKYQKPNVGIEKCYEAPAPAELAAHVERAVRWTRENAAACPAQAVIIYAWNEHDEGGWLCPTLSEGTARIEALGKLLAPRGPTKGENQ